MKIVFFGTPEFSVPFLDALIKDKDIEVAAVVSQEDKPSGRKGEVKPTPVKKIALQHAIDVLQPTTLKKENVIDQLKNFNADFFVVVAYGKILPKSILDLPKSGCINVHPSLLPKYRGPSPMQWSIMNGDKKTGVTIMLLDEGMDTGPILASKSLGLSDYETYPTLVEKVHEIGPQLLTETLKEYKSGNIEPKEQDDQKMSLTKLLSKEDGKIDWSSSMSEIDQKHRTFIPWPGSWTLWEKNGSAQRLKIVDLKKSSANQNTKPGRVKIVDKKLTIDCADGTIEILKIQPEGKSPMSAEEFINGNQDFAGSILN